MVNEYDDVESGSRSARRNDLSNIAIMIHEDFRRLVATLERTMNFADESDGELVDQVANMIAVAQQGLKLSESLLSVTRTPRD